MYGGLTSDALVLGVSATATIWKAIEVNRGAAREYIDEIDGINTYRLQVISVCVLLLHLCNVS